MGDVLAARHSSQDLPFLVSEVVRHQQLDGPAYDLARLVPVNALGARIPGHHDAIERLAQNRIIRRLDDRSESRQGFGGLVPLGEVALDGRCTNDRSRMVPNRCDGQLDRNDAAVLSDPRSLEAEDLLAAGNPLENPLLLVVELRWDEPIDRGTLHLASAIAKESLGARVPANDGPVQQLVYDRVRRCRGERSQPGGGQPVLLFASVLLVQVGHWLVTGVT